jgi:hypothetical protein
MNLDLITMKTVADTLLSSYGKPVAEGWSRYSTGRSIGWAVGWAIGTILFIAAIWIAIKLWKYVRKDENVDYGFEIIAILLLLCYAVGWLIYVGATIIDFSVAMYYPDVYWLLHDIKKAAAELAMRR